MSKSSFHLPVQVPMLSGKPLPYLYIPQIPFPVRNPLQYPRRFSQTLFRFSYSNADRNAGIHIPGEVDIPDRTAVDAALIIFQFSDQLAGSGSSVPPESVPAGSTASIASNASCFSSISPRTVEPMCITWEKRSIECSF